MGIGAAVIVINASLCFGDPKRHRLDMGGNRNYERILANRFQIIDQGFFQIPAIDKDDMGFGNGS